MTNQLSKVAKCIRALPEGEGITHVMHVLAHRPGFADLLLEAANTVTKHGGTVDYTSWCGVMGWSGKTEPGQPFPLPYTRTPVGGFLPSHALLLTLRGGYTVNPAHRTGRAWDYIDRAAGLGRNTPPELTAEQAVTIGGLCNANATPRCTAPDILALTGIRHLVPAIDEHGVTAQALVTALSGAAKPPCTRLYIARDALMRTLVWSRGLEGANVPVALRGALLKNLVDIEPTEAATLEAAEALIQAPGIIEHFTVDGQPIIELLEAALPEWAYPMIHAAS
ncbi:hypothetical protein [Mycobacteroides abscessus]|uniref:hypothetical protein n=1 Tax=Mycobacteroides abscessus TaxID=36809 RepID=UPI0009A77BEC|nr:hypothetical protein [Mycobacteroides abscessus]SLC41790.1 Uncharacterised protein [Mycobacteroides abscessus subsp. abscessus]